MLLLAGWLCLPPAALSAAAASAAADTDFAARCRAPGVTLCVGFDTPGDFAPEHLLPAFDDRVRIVLDRQQVASGEGSARFEVPPFSGASPSGGWTASLGRGFGPGQHLYLQFRQRFSPEMLNTRFEPEGGWKQIIIYGRRSCGSVELTTVNQYLQGFPTMYTDCGARNLQVDLDHGDVLLQQGDYECHYQGTRPPSECGYYRPNEWMTFYYDIEIGQWDQPSSNIRAYMAYEGEPLKQFVDIHNYSLHYDTGPRDRYRRVLLTTYMTYKDPSQEHPVAWTWYDELIVSGKPIAAPGQSAGKQR